MMFPDEKPLCVSTIYRHVKTGRLPNIRAKTHFRRKGKRIVRRDANYNTIHPERTIPEWDEAIRMRLRIGDFEGDTVYGTTGKGLLVTLVDRKSRFLFISIIRSRNARETREAIKRMLKGVPVKASRWTTARSSRSSGNWKRPSALRYTSPSRTSHGSADKLDCWVIQVIDTGGGFDAAKTLRDIDSGESDSVGLKSLTLRLKNLCKHMLR